MFHKMKTQNQNQIKYNIDTNQMKIKRKIEYKPFEVYSDNLLPKSFVCDCPKPQTVELSPAVFLVMIITQKMFHLLNNNLHIFCEMLLHETIIIM